MTQSADAVPSPSQNQQDNPLANIILNVLAPVLILSYCSKEGDAVYHLGPYQAMALALAVPIAYGIWHFIAHRKFNIFSAVGFLNVLLTGAITIYLFTATDPGTRANAPLFFGLKEAIQPLILGSLFLITHRSKSPLFNLFIYSDALFDHQRITKAVAKNQQDLPYMKLLWSSTLLFFGSFCLSALMNLGLAYYFLADLDPHAENWKELYNQDVARITGWGFLVIGVPLLVVGGFILWRLIKGLEQLTGLSRDEVLMAR
ncbi:MAG: VC0807 family protein [Verrucomicrobiales bacterium]